MAREPSDDWICIGCGCTNARACPGGCYWIDANKCSACFDADGDRYAVDAEEGSALGIELCPASETPAPHAVLFTSETEWHCPRCRQGFFT